VRHAYPAAYEYAITHPASRVTYKPRTYGHQFIDPHYHHPSKVQAFTNALDKDYYKGTKEHYEYERDKSKAKVAAQALHHIMNGRPVRTVLHDGVKVLHQPGPKNKKAALDAHHNDQIHSIVHNGFYDDPFVMVPPRNKADRPLSRTKRKALHSFLDDRVAVAQHIDTRTKTLTPKKIDPSTGTLMETKRKPSLDEIISRTRQRNRNFAEGRERSNRYQPY
jgi:hypothetical protein